MSNDKHTHCVLQNITQTGRACSLTHMDLGIHCSTRSSSVPNILNYTHYIARRKEGVQSELLYTFAPHFRSHIFFLKKVNSNNK